MVHRGPDGEGKYIEGPVGLGHRRLSIIDVEGGAQPIGNEDGRIQIVFNGEIYNYIELKKELEKSGHIFKTRSDTEVIVHGYEEWGLKCVQRFNGIFAFGLWDSRLRRLFLARDHLGVKPLYYAISDDKLLFASEIKALLADKNCPKSINLSGLGQLFTFRYVPSPETMFQGIMKLPPAHYMIIDANGCHIKKFWNWVPRIDHVHKFNELIVQYQDLLEDSIRLQLRSDVPIGLFLSSGIDSSVILAIMRKYISGPIYTFTIGFQHGERTNEINDAAEMARVYGAEHTDMIIGPKDYEKYYERYLLDLEEPVGNETAAAFYFVSNLAQRKVKVALTGQGADEPWAGYHRHIGARFSHLYRKLPLWLTESVIKPLGKSIPRNEKIKRAINSLSEQDTLTRLAKIYSFFDAEMKDKLFQDWVKQEIGYDGYAAKECLRRLLDDVSSHDPLTQMLYIDTRANLPDDLLMVTDKTAMANSVEARVPFLDYRLVEFIETLRPKFKLTLLHRKYLHKKAMEKWLPKKISIKRKRGLKILLINGWL